jgi:transposase-like protein
VFRPSRCPYRACRRHRRPERDFCVRFGSYHPKCRPRPVPRFRCRTCRRTFSRQTFRADYRDRRPDLNQRLFLSIASGIGLRQTSRTLGLSLRCTELKFRKIARHLRRLNLNLRGPLPEDSVFQFDELETFETRRNTRPLSVPVLIERDSRYLIWAEAAPIRPRGKMTEARKRAIGEEERRSGPRKDLSMHSIRRTLRRGRDLAEELPLVVFESDEKSTYPALAREAFGESRLVHQTTSSTLARMTWNPLFPINHTEAMARDLLGRLRRESWLVSKKRRYLDLGLQLWMTYRNLVRRRFNRDEESPAELLGFVERRMSAGEVLSWRQDWGRESIHPLSRRGVPIARRRARRAA